MSARRIILAGGSGFLGQLLAEYLHARGWEPVILTRRPSARARFKEVAWDARRAGDWARELEGAEAVINLAGRSVNCRFTAENKKLVMDSRVESTRAIGEAITRCAEPPRAWLNCGTATIYRPTLGAAHDESSTDFAATPSVHDEYSVQVARAWEQAQATCATPRTRQVALRITLVFGTVPGGVFQILRRLARLGLGGRMGSGQQFVSWIHEEDFCRAVEWILEHETLHGPVNLAAPEPLPNAEMMRTFRRVCGGVPVGLPAFEWMLEVGAFFMRTETELILKSRRVVPGKLLADGFAFCFPGMEAAVRDLEKRFA
jgi:uncharacterized protein (TIGR01777 family)